jgi:hypothetical protein
MVMLALTIYELHEVFKNTNATILEVTIAKALVKGIDRGSINNLNELLNRTMGKPKEVTNQKNDDKIEFVFVQGKTIL